MSLVVKEIMDYCERMSSAVSNNAQEIYRRTQLHHHNPKMMSDPLQGQLIRFISLFVKAERVLEIGTFTGFSASCLVDGLSKNAEMISIEIDEEHFEEAKANLENCNKRNQLKLFFGDAIDIIPKLEGEFDLVFIDAAKKFYEDYFELVLAKLKVGGLIIVDNVLWYGKVLQENQDPTTVAIHLFNKKIAEDDRVEQVMLPIIDGLLLIIKK